MVMPGENTQGQGKGEMGITEERKSDPSSVKAQTSGYQLIRHSGLKLRLQLQPRVLQRLLNRESFWARGRSLGDLRRMLAGSQVVVSAWDGSELVGFGRATSDGVFRAVLWDIVVNVDHRGQSLGSEIVGLLLADPQIARAERVYLMTTKAEAFYTKLEFHENHGQKLMIREASLVASN